MQKIKVTIVIVFYRDKNKLLKCLTSIKKSNIKLGYEIIVVNNSAESLNLRGVKHIKASKNLGYGAGNNLGIKSANGEYIFVLNPDTEILPRSIDKLVNFLNQNKKVAVVAPILLDSQGKPFSQIDDKELTPTIALFTLSFLGKFFLKLTPATTTQKVDAVQGSAFMIRKKVFVEADGFDENLFLFFEENDLAKRVRALGYQIFVNPDSKVIHYWRKNPKLKKYFNKSRFYYFKKHYGLIWALIIELVTG